MATFDTPVRTGTGRVNLIPSPSFQFASNVAGNGWGLEGVCTSAINTSTQFRGSQSMQLTATGAGAMSIWGYHPSIVGTASGPIAITPGATYTFSIWVRAANAGGATRTVFPTLAFYNADRVTAGSAPAGTAVAITTTGWTQISVTATAAATAYFAAFKLTANAGAANDSVIFDCAVLEPTSTVLPYFDGSVDGGRWSGTVENSASYSVSLDAGNALVANLRTPVLATDAANKSYVDGALTGGFKATGVSKRVNLITNPSFETTTTGWTKLTGPTNALTTNASYAYAGTRSLQLTSTTAASAIGAYTTVSGLSPNTTYTFSFWAQTGTNPTNVTPGVTTLNSVGTTVAALVSGTAVSARLLFWSRVSQTFTTGATATQATLQFTLTPAATTDNYQFDGFMLEAASTAGTYFDGSFANARWLGTAHASGSELVALDANTAAIANVATPTLAGDAANKSYVDTLALTTAASLGPATKRTNLVTNPSFETAVTGWSLTTGTGGIGRYQPTMITGFQGSWTLGGLSTSASLLTVSSSLLPIPAASVDYVASFYGAYASFATTVTPQLVFYDASATLLGTFSGTATAAASLASGTATRFTVGATAPATAAFAQINIKWTPGSTNDPLYIDGVLLEQQPATNPPGTYFDGSMTGYRWTGTAHVSSSETALTAQTLAITNLGTPVAAADAATKAYVDSATPTSFGKVVLGTSSVYKANMMPNPSFQDGTSNGWTATGASLGASTSPAADNYALQVASTATSLIVSSPVISNIIPGVTYVLSCQGRYVTATRSPQLAINWIGTNGTVIGTSIGGGWALTNAFVQNFVTGVAPTGAKTAQVQIIFGSSASGENYAFDKFQFETGNAPSIYNDGESTNWHWTGTRYTSWSETYYAGFNGNTVTGVADPQNLSDVATKNYVDNIHQSHPRVSVTQTYNYNLFPSASVTAGQNIWGAFTANTSVGVTTSPVYDGTHAAQLTSSLAGDRTATSSAYLIPVTPGQTYSAALWVRAATQGRTARLDVQFYNNAKVLIATVTGPTSIVDSTTGWTQTYSSPAGAPPGAWYACLTITFVNTAASEVHYFDYAVFVVGNNATIATPLDPAFSPAYRYQAGVLTGGVDTYAFDANNNPIINVALPVVANDAANKAYVDSRADLYRQTQTLASAVSTVDFYLPPGARNATLKWLCRSTDTTGSSGITSLSMRVNGSSANLYNYLQSQQVGAAAPTQGQASTNSAFLGQVANAFSNATRSGSGTLELYGIDQSGGDGLHFISRAETFSSTAAQYWFQASGYVALVPPYTQITLLLGTGNFGIGSQFSLICE